MPNTMSKIDEIMCDNPGKITRLIDGLYTKPKYSDILNEYSYPTASQVAEKIAEKFSWTIAPTNEIALNYVGLSTQVPNEYVYISDGAYRTYDYRNKKNIQAIEI